jgi:ATPase subunit of ABC transporter with duplicated ATPase domains
MAAYQYIYVMKGLTKIYPGGRKVLENVWLSFLPGAKIGVLGHNGAGKSTLLRMMAGIDKDFSGEAWAAEGATVGFLPQEPQLDPAKDVLGNVMEGVGATAALLKEFEDVSNAMADPDADFDKLLARQAELQEQIEHADAWDIQRKVEIAMDALRCPAGDADVTKLSGGERRRVALCRLLLSNPTCCCWTNRPTISTRNRSPGWRPSCRNTRVAWSPSRTTAISSTTLPAGFLSWIAARASPTKATIPAGWSRRRSA